MNSKFVLAGAAAIVLAGGALLFRSMPVSVAADTSTAQSGFVTLNRSLDQLIEDFNAATGKTRLVFVVGPSCGPCLRGLDDMNRVVGDMTRNNPDLKAFVLYVPTLGAEERHAARAVRLMEGRDIRHYWDPEGQSGLALQEAIGINAYAWDVWLVYDRDAVWSESGAPKPVHWEHQLGGLPHDKRLDPKRFAAKVAAVLSEGSAGD